MAELEVNGGVVVYELIGPEDGEVLTVTPGGRFSKDYPGVRPFAEELAAHGKRVLIWDRPNTGASDIQLYGASESHMRAATLAGLVTGLGLGPVVALGGSGGARDSIVFAIEYPELVRKLVVWSIVGGAFSSMSLASVYVLDEIRTIRRSGIDGILDLVGRAGSWSDLVKANPRNEQRLRDLGAEEFERVMWRWFEAYVPKPNEAIPGVPDHLMRGIDVPTLIVRGGEEDIDHPKRTSFEVHALIKGSRLIEPPWPEDAWERAQEARDAGRGSIFDPWMKAVPTFLDFVAEPARPTGVFPSDPA
ncbi:alpha/beta hydrolase [Actinocorallia sp. A-T 12471]|uniref:alpha/beta fold hydrolase n=1 Tax=Actinocorallia sp. A-T 12471 TaxID=3089813 RepID=UPI0029D35F20|nr:alpha/beta hydrolase [Actinocorallia sp. A-T 12471]MDX6740176.1 alpha/beta hydrolase [Actinocorallia sp. A-T 12471]